MKIKKDDRRDNKMDILLIGAGALGLGLGTSVASQGAELSILASKETGNIISEKGIKRTGLLKDIEIKPERLNVYTDYNEIPHDKYDYVFISTKTYTNPTVSQELYKHRKILKENCKIIIFQNGFGNDEEYLKYFDKNRIYCGCVFTGFERIDKHISKITGIAKPLLIGSLQNSNINDIMIITEMLSESGYESDITDEIDKALLSKILINCPLNPLCGIFNCTYGKLSENKYYTNLIEKIVDEIFDVIDASPYNSPYKNKEEFNDYLFNTFLKDGYYHEPSTLQDIKKKQKTEIDSLNGKIIKLGKKFNVETPVNETVYNMIKAIETYY